MKIFSQAQHTNITGTPEHEKRKEAMNRCVTRIFKGVGGKLKRENCHVKQYVTIWNYLNKLEKVIISKIILFSKVLVMPKGHSSKIKGAVCNVPVEADSMCNIFPRGADSNGLILLKLKRKLSYHGHVLFEPVRPDIVKLALP